MRRRTLAIVVSAWYAGMKIRTRFLPDVPIFGCLYHILPAQAGGNVSGARQTRGGDRQSAEKPDKSEPACTYGSEVSSENYAAAPVRSPGPENIRGPQAGSHTTLDANSTA